MTDVERPRHRRSITDSRAYHPLRYLRLHTFRRPSVTTVTTELLVANESDGLPGIASISLNREGREQLIRELRRANDYEDLIKANPESRDL